ncbi:MAG: hypothetical protein ABI612_23145 [Betaproteobacteria bacterium]
MDLNKGNAGRVGERNDLKLIKTSMLQELGVSLRDFLPQDGGHLIRVSGGPVVISTRLLNALRSYAAHRGITLMLALDRLRDEIQKQHVDR